MCLPLTYWHNFSLDTGNDPVSCRYILLTALRVKLRRTTFKLLELTDVKCRLCKAGENQRYPYLGRLPLYVGLMILYLSTTSRVIATAQSMAWTQSMAWSSQRLHQSVANSCVWHWDSPLSQSRLFLKKHAPWLTFTVPVVFFIV